MSTFKVPTVGAEFTVQKATDYYVNQYNKRLADVRLILPYLERFPFLRQYPVAHQAIYEDVRLKQHPKFLAYLRVTDEEFHRYVREQAVVTDKEVRINMRRTRYQYEEKLYFGRQLDHLLRVQQLIIKQAAGFSPAGTPLPTTEALLEKPLVNMNIAAAVGMLAFGHMGYLAPPPAYINQTPTPLPSDTSLIVLKSAKI